MHNLRGGIALDCGCGSRGALVELSRKHKYVIGLELVLEALKEAKKLSLDNVDLVQGDAHYLPFRNYVFN